VKKKEKKSLEIKTEDRMKKTVDSLAVKRDSIYWSDVRTLPLSEEELKSYARKDTMQAYVDSVAEIEISPKFKPSDLLYGGKVGNDSSAFVRFSYSGAMDVFREYNYVDGVWLGQSFGLDFRKKKPTGLRIDPSVHWASARKSLLWESDFTLDYAPLRLGQLFLSAGKTTADYSGDKGMERLINAAYSLDGGRNYAKFYEKTYIEANNFIDIDNGLRLGIGFELAKRKQVENHTTWNIFGIKDKWTPNVPEYKGELNPQYSDLARYAIQLSYTPFFYYRITDGRKRYVRSAYPTFTATYIQGLSRGSKENYSESSLLQLTVRQNIKLGVFNNFNYRIIAGKFLNQNEFNYIDYKHFETAGNLLITLKDWNRSYALLPMYTFSTGKEWVQAFVNYETDYLLLKRIPYFQGKLFQEVLQGKFLHTPDKRYYSEWGYSVNVLGGVGGAGVFVAFDSFKYNGVGLQISLPLVGVISRLAR
jgi:hypothetical protein